MVSVCFQIEIKHKLKAYEYTAMFFFRHVSKGDNFRDFLFANMDHAALSQIGSTLTGKNLLLWEQILFFES